MKDLFQLAKGTITGREHIRLGKNNQDAYYSVSNEDYTIAVVCDGCGSGLHSEVGAKIGAKLVVKAISNELQNGLDNTNFWDNIRLNLLSEIKKIVNILTEEDIVKFIYDYFLFTIVGVIITPSKTIIFTIGDGVIIVNNEQTFIESFSNNAPPYLAYGLCNYPELSEFKIYHELETKDINNILIGTDGVNDLIKAENNNFPGKLDKKIGNISQFWEEDSYFKNREAIRRKLNLINREFTKADWINQCLKKEVGLLPDDTTFIVIKKI